MEVADSHGDIGKRFCHKAQPGQKKKSRTRARTSRAFQAVMIGRVSPHSALGAKREPGMGEQGLQASEHMGDKTASDRNGRTRERWCP